MMVPSKKHLLRSDGMTLCGLNSLAVETVKVWDVQRDETCKTCLNRLDQIAEIERKKMNQ